MDKESFSDMGFANVILLSVADEVSFMIFLSYITVFVCKNVLQDLGLKHFL